MKSDTYVNAQFFANQPKGKITYSLLWIFLEGKELYLLKPEPLIVQRRLSKRNQSLFAFLDFFYQRFQHDLLFVTLWYIQSQLYVGLMVIGCKFRFPVDYLVLVLIYSRIFVANFKGNPECQRGGLRISSTCNKYYKVLNNPYVGIIVQVFFSFNSTTVLCISYFFRLTSAEKYLKNWSSK